MNNNPSRFSKWCIKQWEHKRSWILKCQTFDTEMPNLRVFHCSKHHPMALSEKGVPQNKPCLLLGGFNPSPQKCFIYCGQKKSCTTWDGRKPVNNGINHLWCRISSIHRMTRLNQSSQVQFNPTTILLSLLFSIKIPSEFLRWPPSVVFVGQPH